MYVNSVRRYIHALTFFFTVTPMALSSQNHALSPLSVPPALVPTVRWARLE